MKPRFFFLLLLSFVFIVNHAQVPTEGLVGHWPFNGNANDESGNGNHGVVNGAVLTYDRNGNPNSAYYFNGQHSITTSFQGVEGNGARSISFWAKLDEDDNGGNICHYGGGYGTSFDPKVGIVSAGIDISNSTVHFGTDSNNDDAWHHFVVMFSTQFGSSLNGIRIYRDQVLLTDIVNSYHYTLYSVNTSLSNFTMGSPNSNVSFALDDLRFYNRVLSEDEIYEIFTQEFCSDTVINDTITYYISSAEFESRSPKIYLESIDSLTKETGGCDSIIQHFTRYEFMPQYCTDTLWTNDTIWHHDTIWVSDTITTEVMDTIFVTVTDSITVTDTLIIDAVLTGIDGPGNINTIKVYPNPARDFIFINTGDYTRMNGYTLKIIDQLGSIVYETNVEEPLYEVNLSTWTGYGLYYIQVIDVGGNIIDIKKIILR